MSSQILFPLERAGGPAVILGAVALATVFQRLRDLLKGAEPEGAGAAPLQTEPQAQRLSDRTTNAPRETPPDPRKIDLLIDLGRKLAATSELQDLEPLLLPSLDVLCNALGAERATIFIRRRGSAELMSYVGVGLAGSRSILIPATQGIAGDCLRLGTIVVSNDLTRDTRHYSAVDQATGFTTLNILAAPLKDSIGNYFGVIEVLNKPGGFTATDQALILPFVSSLTDALFPHVGRLS